MKRLPVESTAGTCALSGCAAMAFPPISHSHVYRVHGNLECACGGRVVIDLKPAGLPVTYTGIPCDSCERTFTIEVLAGGRVRYTV